MPGEGLIARFYFHFRNGVQHERDNDGLEFPSFEDACAEAYGAIPPLWCELQREGKDPSGYVVEITDKDGCALVDIPFTEGMRLKAGRPALMVEAFRMRRLTDDLSSELARARTILESSRAFLTRLQRLSPADRDKFSPLFD